MTLGASRTHDPERPPQRYAPFDLVADLHRLERAVNETANCRLVVLDPVTAYLGGTDSHRNAEIRALLAPLSDLAARLGVAVLAVTHLRKGEGPAIYRLMGSLAFVAAARAAYAVGRDPDDTTGARRFVVPVKNNLGNDRTGLAYRLMAPDGGVPAVAWEPEPVEVPADDVLGAMSPGKPGPEPRERTEATEWLRNALANGPRPSRELFAEAKRDGISEGTLKRAKRELGVKAEKADWEGGWIWRLPEGPPDPQTGITCAPSGGPAPLGENKGLMPHLPGPEPPEGVEGAQVPECGSEASGPARVLDPDRPGPIDLLSPEQRQEYQETYHALDGDPTEKHRVAWRRAVNLKKDVDTAAHVCNNSYQMADEAQETRNDDGPTAKGSRRSRLVPRGGTSHRR